MLDQCRSLTIHHFKKCTIPPIHRHPSLLWPALMNLVHTTHSHLLPQQDPNSLSLYSSATTSTHIPDIPFENFSLSYLQSSTSRNTETTSSSRRDRRARVSPYPLAPTQAAPSDAASFSQAQYVPMYSPQPSQYVPLQHSLDFAVGSPSTFTFPTTAQDSFAAPMTSIELIYSHPTQVHAPHHDSSFIHQVPQFPQGSPPDPVHEYTSFPPSYREQQSTAQTQDHVHATPKPSGGWLHCTTSSDTAVAPSTSSTFQTPVEVIGNLSKCTRGTSKKVPASRRTDRGPGRTQSQHYRQAVFPADMGFTPSDPDTITSHDKKRLYLDCLESYVVYLHQQMRLAGIEPVPIERVSSGRGLVSRSIRTIIILLRKMTADYHRRKRENEIKYKKLQALLAQSADLEFSTTPSTTLVDFNKTPSLPVASLKQ